MAGRFLTLEEAALQLGVEPEEVNRLVDRKKLFPMRDGASLKFRSDDVQRYIDSKGESSDPKSDLSLDFDEPAAGGNSEIELGDAIAIDGGSIFDEAPAKGGSQTILRKGSEAQNDGESELQFGSALGAPDGSAIGGKSSGIAGDSLGLGSIAIGSSPTNEPGTGSVTGDPGGTMALSDVARVTGISDQSGLSIAGESGLSLEDEDVQLSGIQLSGIDISVAGGSIVEASGVDLGPIGGNDGGLEGGTMLGGDAFELGPAGADDESASVVIATDSESGDSSFFGATIAGGDSSSEEPLMQTGSSALELPVEHFVGTTFSALQICGLACCAVLLLIAGFICYDVVLSIGSVRGAPFATPILDSLTQVFGLR